SGPLDEPIGIESTREDPDRDRPSQGDADDGEEDQHRQPERAALEEDAADVISERLADIVQNGERGADETIRNGTEEAALEVSGIPQQKEEDQRSDHPRRQDVAERTRLTVRYGRRRRGRRRSAG